MDQGEGEETWGRRELNKGELHDWNGRRRYGEEIKKDEMDWTCGTHRREEEL